MLSFCYGKDDKYIISSYHNILNEVRVDEQ